MQGHTVNKPWPIGQADWLSCQKPEGLTVLCITAHTVLYPHKLFPVHTGTIQAVHVIAPQCFSLFVATLSLCSGLSVRLFSLPNQKQAASQPALCLRLRCCPELLSVELAGFSILYFLILCHNMMPPQPRKLGKLNASSSSTSAAAAPPHHRSVSDILPMTGTMFLQKL